MERTSIEDAAVCGGMGPGTGDISSVLGFTMMGGVDAILGRPWLREVNPQVDWVRGVIRCGEKVMMGTACGGGGP